MLSTSHPHHPHKFLPASPYRLPWPPPLEQESRTPISHPSLLSKIWPPFWKYSAWRMAQELHLRKSLGEARKVLLPTSLYQRPGERREAVLLPHLAEKFQQWLDKELWIYCLSQSNTVRHNLWLLAWGLLPRPLWAVWGWIGKRTCKGPCAWEKH